MRTSGHGFLHSLAILGLVCGTLVIGSSGSVGDTTETVERPQLNAPKEWRGERIKLPPEFAPNMKLRGIEEIRFAPGMFDATSPSFFSYVFVLHLPEQAPPGTKAIEHDILAYYQGLAKAVGEGRELTIDTKTFKLEEAPKLPQSPNQVRVDKNDFPVKSFVLSWTEPFVTGKPQKLHLEIVSGQYPGTKDSFVYVCASPADKSTKIWTQMRDIRSGYKIQN